jgi:predicted permease
LAFTALLVVLVVAVAGLGPALQSTRIDITSALRDGAAGSSVRRTRLRRVFLGLQVTVSTVLVACAGLFLHSLRNADKIDAGFDTARILNAPIELGRGRDAASGSALISQVQSRVRELPGVVGVAGASIVPLSGNNAETSIALEGDAADARRQTYFVSVTPGYFATMRMPLVRGREFAETDRAGSTPVAIVNETMEKQFWPGASAIGKRISMNGPGGPWMEIVGVSRSIRYNSLGETPPVFLYVPFDQVGNDGLTLHVVMAPGAAVANVSAGIVAAVRALDPAIPPPAVRLLADEQRIVLLPARLGAGLTGAFGALALLLAAVGIFGVAAFDVSLRRREMGIRSALGAPASSILQTVLGETARTVVTGAAIGLTLAMVLGRVLSSQLYGVSAVDPMTFLLTPLVLVVVAVAATLAPAYRAVRIDPADALREG